MAPVVGSARLLTLGRLALLDGERRDLLPPESTKMLGLLAFLTAAPGRRATREQLMDLFWDDRSLRLARSSLRQALHRLRDTLGEDQLLSGPKGDVLLTRELACDRDEFLASIAAGALDEALERYRGPFVPGFLTRGGTAFEQWRDQERERLYHLYAAAAESVAQRALEAGDPKRAGSIATRLLTDHPLNERAWRLRLQAEQAAGSHVHLVGSIGELRRLLATEGWQPEARTLQLLQSLERPLEASTDDAEAAQLITDLVGRGPVLARLHEAWREAKRRHGVHVHVTGGAGIGKTRVMQDFAMRLQAERSRVTRARALPRQRLVPGAMLASLISALVELPGATGISEHSARVLLGLQPAISNRFPSAVPFDFTQLDTRFVARLEALDDLVGAVSHEGPLCLLLDDVHWWDDTSRRTIEHLIERLDGRPVLVVTASRPGPGEMTTVGTREKITLAPLAHGDVVVLLQSLGEHADPTAIDRLADGLQRAADGVPLLVLEAIRLGLDRDLLRLADQRWHLDRLDEFLAILHPGRLLNERLATLTAPQMTVLLVAWLAEFPLLVDDIAVIDDGADSGTLVELERLGFLTSTHAGWVISHDSVGEAVEASANAELLRRSHRAAGLLTRRRGDHAAMLGQAAKLFLEADAQDELLEATSVWLRQRRAEQSVAPTRELIGDLLGPSASATMVKLLIARMPRDLKRTPWTAMRLAPIWGVAGAVIMAAGWWASTRTPPPDAVLGMLDRSKDGQIIESRIALRQGSWAASDFKLVAARQRDLSEWGAAFHALEPVAPVKDPMHNRWVTYRLEPADPSGPTDLLLWENGRTRPLASAPGDDVGPSWSPDGRFVTFSTTRWSPPDDANFDIGVVEVATGEVRQLTRGPDSDKVPFWSPDGTRIGFFRRAEQLAPDSLCWVAVDASRRKCRPVPSGQVNGISGWIDNHSLIVTGGLQGGNIIEYDDLDGGPDRFPGLAANSDIKLSPDGAWLAYLQPQLEGSQTGILMTVVQVASPGTRRSILFRQDEAPRVFWDQFAANRGLVTLTIVRSPDTLIANTPFRLTIEGTGAAGNVMPLPSAVIAWTSSDTTVAKVNDQGEVRGRASGVVTITASAGGWRQASVRMVVRAEPAQLALDEQWHEEWPGAWVAWGPPWPSLVALPNGKKAMISNGDGIYSSGLVSKQLFSARNGVALDVEVSTPITRPKWQFVQLWIDTPARPTFSGPGGKGGCTLTYPAGEGWLARKSIMGAPADSALATGQWYRLRVQLFPDRTCGYAVNGRAVLHPPNKSIVTDSMDVAVGGQMVGSTLRFGRVRVWAGVPGDIDWGQIGTQATVKRD